MSGLKWIVLLAAMALPGLVALEARNSGSRGAVLVEGAAPSDTALHWQLALRGFSIEADFVRRSELAMDALRGYRMLVVPGVTTFRAGERDRILDFLDSGGGLILTRRAGSSREEGSGRSLADVLGLQYVDPEIRPGVTAWVTLDEVGRLSAGLPRMQRISVDHGEEPVAVETRDLPVASWFTSAVRGGNGGDTVRAGDVPRDLLLWPGTPRQEVAVSGEEAKSRAVLYTGKRGQGRFVWMAFDPDDVGGDLSSSNAYTRLMGNVIAYLRGFPTIELSPWPFPYQHAILFSIDVEERFGNFRNVAGIEDLPSMTYFILTESAGLYDEVLGEISRRPDRQGRADISVHGDNHDLFRGQPPEKQYQRLVRARDYIDAIAAHPPRGFRPPEEAYDFFTLKAFAQAGYRYLLANENPDRAEPEVVDFGDYRFMRLTMLNRDDVDMVVRANQPPPSQVWEEYREDIDRIFRRGGLYILNIHSQILATERYIEVMERVVRKARADKAWMVSGAEVYDWWMARDGVLLEVLDRSVDFMRVRVSQTGASAVGNLAVNIWVPEDGSLRWQIETVPEGRRFSRFQTRENRLTLHLDRLSPGQNQTFLIRWQR